MKVLIVDDEHLEIEQLSFLIKPVYPLWTIFEAEDAVQAMTCLEKHMFPLAFVDIHLPGESGLDLAEWIKEKSPETEIVIVTAYQDFGYAKRAIQLDVLDYLVKPIIADELYDVIKKFLQKHPQVKAKSPVVREALEMIHRYYNEKLNLNVVSAGIHVTPTYLSRRFREELGVTFTDYVIKYRIEKAKALLLKHPEWSIGRVAEAVGFTSQHHFSNSFRKYENVTPTEFRERRM